MNNRPQLDEAKLKADVRTAILKYCEDNKRCFWKNFARAYAYLNAVDTKSSEEIIGDYLQTDKRGVLSSSTDLRDYIGEVIRKNIWKYDDKQEATFNKQVTDRLTANLWAKIPISEKEIRFEFISHALKQINYAPSKLDDQYESTCCFGPGG